MGLFDDIRCDAPLPEGCERAGGKGRWFQTKDFPEPYLDKYAITADGRLVQLDGHDWSKEIQHLADYHGILNFYDYNTDTKEWWKLNAKFTDGRLVGITLAEYRRGDA